jgi:purine-nucleoside phosphorylase
MRETMKKRVSRNDYLECVNQAASFLHRKLLGKKTRSPVLAIVLGSGLGGFADVLGNKKEIPFSIIPHFPVSGVSGHAGTLAVGELNQQPVYCVKGRVHFYEGFDLGQITFMVRVLGALGIQQLILTNAAGGIHPAFKPGDMMLIRDHISSFYPNPLIGKNQDSFGPRFPDMSDAYSKAWRGLAKRAARRVGVRLKEGVYLAVTGPSYETPAEIQMFKKMGADAVGMSTVPEVIVARHMGMECLGITTITNLAAGISKTPLNHEEVILAGEKVKERLCRFLIELCTPKKIAVSN